MASPDPIQLLEEELQGKERSLAKSISLYKKGEIDAATHVVHKENLTKSIADYKYAIYLLKQHRR